MTIGYNGVSIADYDPTGIGGIVFAALDSSQVTGDIALGGNVDGAALTLAGLYVDESTSSGIVRRGAALASGTTWKCLGHAKKEAGTTENATMWMRVA
jgi:hypothetical protein